MVQETPPEAYLKYRNLTGRGCLLVFFRTAHFVWTSMVLIEQRWCVSNCIVSVQKKRKILFTGSEHTKLDAISHEK